MNFDYESILNERKLNPSIKLLHTDHFPFIISFLYLQFKKSNQITIPANDLEIKLTDYIHILSMKYGDIISFPDKPIHYLERWADDGYLRRYYPSTSTDISVFELTSSTEKVIGWLGELKEREFIGTDSRLKQILDLVKTISEKTSVNTQARLVRLKKKKEELEKEIKKLESGIWETLSETQIKEYFLEAKESANRLLRDFADIKEKFRKISQEVKEKQVQAYQKKGKLISDIFTMQDQILQSDQGQSFKAFWEFLLLQSKEEEFEQDLKYICSLPEISKINNDDFMVRLKTHLLDAGSKVNHTRGELNEQLSRFLDEKTFIENRRVQELLVEIKSIAMKIKNQPPNDKNFFTIDENKPNIQLIMDRPLWKDSGNLSIAEEDFEIGLGNMEDSDALFSQHYIDYDLLRTNIFQILEKSSQVSLKEISVEYPMSKGISEIVGYFSIGNKYFNEGKALIDEETIEEIEVKNLKTDRNYFVKVPRLIFKK
jgi:hypothetical protein